MNYKIKDVAYLRKILWLDFFMGVSSAIIGMIFYNELASILGLPKDFILWISIITLMYSLVAFGLAYRTVICIPLLRILITANWIWTLISSYFIYIHFSQATLLGQVFLIFQIVVVGGLAFIEGKQLSKFED